MATVKYMARCVPEAGTHTDKDIAGCVPPRRKGACPSPGRSGGRRRNGVIRPIVGERFRRYDGRVGNPYFAMHKKVAAFALYLFCPAVAAQDQDLWRFWTRSDGLQETYSYSLGFGEGGSVTIRHGAVPFLSVLDGYGVVRIPDQHIPDRVNSVTRGRATPGANGATWTASDGNLTEYRAGRWILRYLTPRGLRLITAAPAGNRVIVLFSDAVREYDPAGGAWSPWRSPGGTRLGDFTAMTAQAARFVARCARC